MIRTIAAHARRAPAGTDRSSPPPEAVREHGAGPTRSQFADDPEMASILEEFLSRLDGQVEAMRKSHAEGRPEELQRLAHMLKGAAGSYGYPSLTQACRVLEDAAKARRGDEVRRDIDDVAAVVQAIQNGSVAYASVGEVLE